MEKVEIEYDVKESKELGELIASLSAPNNDGASVKFDIERTDRKLLVSIYPSAY